MKQWGFTLENITSYWVDGKNILENINFSFPINNTKAAILPLMGPSGQGKSTLLYLLAAMKWPNSGKVIWRFPDGTTHQFSKAGNQLTTQQVIQLHRNLFGFAFQDSTLSPHLTIIENIAYPLVSQGKTWQEALDIAEEHFQKILLPSEKKHQKHLMQSFPSQLSGGQKQRTALAQAIVHNPTVLFADEPTGQLDRRTRKQVMGVLKDWVIAGKGQQALIWVTHHHVDDLDLMGIDQFLFIENQTCSIKERQWLEEWAKL